MIHTLNLKLIHIPNPPQNQTAEPNSHVQLKARCGGTHPFCSMHEVNEIRSQRTRE